MAVDYGSLPFAEALKFLQGKLNLPTKKWDDLLGAAHDRAFVVAGAMQADLLADLKAAVEKAIEQGTTLEAFRKDFNQIVADRGWTGWTGKGSKAGRAWRAQIIYDTNLFTSYAAGRYQQMQEVAADRPYWRYRHSDASVVPRPEHRAWDGLILRNDDPWWNVHAPPSGFGCKCFVETLSEREMKKAGLKITPKDEIPYNGQIKGVDPKTGEEFTRPEGVDKGWDYQPGAKRTTPLFDLIARKLPALDSPLGAALWDALKDALKMETQRAWTQALDEWLSSGQPAGRLAVVGAIDPKILTWLAAQKTIQPATAEIVIYDRLVLGRKQRRHATAGDALTEAEWRQLPEMLAAPQQVLFDTRSGKLLYLFPAGGTDSVKIAVEFDYQEKRGKGRVNQIVSAFKTSDASIVAGLKGGQFEKVR